MPRGHGGSRDGTPGTSYPNRSDLSKPKQVAIPGQGYGVQAQQIADQQALPVASSSTATPPVSAPETTSSPGLAAAAAFEMPQGLTPVDAPTERPTEPLTAGIQSGPGPGPEVLGSVFNPGTAAALLAYLASQPTATQGVKDLSYKVGQPRQIQLPALPNPQLQGQAPSPNG